MRCLSFWPPLSHHPLLPPPRVLPTTTSTTLTTFLSIAYAGRRCCPPIHPTIVIGAVPSLLSQRLSTHPHQSQRFMAQASNVPVAERPLNAGCISDALRRPPPPSNLLCTEWLTGPGSSAWVLVG